MGFRIGLIPAAGLPFVAGFFIFNRLFFEAPFSTLKESYVVSCGYTHNMPKPLRDMLCILDPFFVGIVQDKLAVALFYLAVVLWAPVSLWLFEQGGKYGRSALLSPLFPFIVSSLGQLFGIGPTSSMLVPSIYALVKAMEPSKQGLYAPASTTYTFTNFGLHQIVLALSLGMLRIPRTEMPEAWQIMFYGFQIFPVVFLPLLLFRSSPPNKQDVPRSTNIFDFLGIVLIPAWWIVISTSIYQYSQLKGTITPFALFMFWDSTGVFVTIIGLYLVEVVSGDAKGLPSLLFDSVWAGPPAAAVRYFAAKERQAAKRVTALKKTK